MHPKLTGLSAVGQSLQDCDIKLDKVVIGLISAPNWRTKDNKYSVRLKVKKERTEEEPCPFCWVSLKKKTDSLQEMKDWLNIVAQTLAEKYDFYLNDN